MIGERIPQSVTKRVPLKAYLSSDHLSDGTGLTIPVTISKNGAGFGNPSAGATNATEIGNGWYYVDLSATDTGTQGPLIVRGTNASADTIEIAFTVVDAHNAGFDGVPSAAARTASGLPATVDFFILNSGSTYAASVAGSVVREIVSNSSGTGADPWGTLLPGAYSSGTAGNIVGTFLLRQGNVVFQRGVAYPNFTFSMKGSDGAPKSGLTVTAERSLDGAAFATASNAVSELSDGWYALSMSAADMNGAVIGWRMSASGAVDRNFTMLTQLPSP